MAGKCPKCEKSISRVTVDHINIAEGIHVWNGVSYLCPSCSSILGISIDPISIKTDIVEEVLLGLGKL
jgi:hypothetical protein